MALVAAFLVFGVVIAIAAVIVVREAGRMTKEPPPVLFSMDEAYDFVIAVATGQLTEIDAIAAVMRRGSEPR